jgi:hypothetical protein
MNQLTNFYKNKAEILAEQIKFLENQLKQLAEDAPGYSFTPGNKNAPRQSDADLQARARSIKKSGLFGAEISDDKQSQEYRDIQAELASRKGTQTSAGNLEKTQPKTSIPAAPPATVTRSEPPTISKPKVELRPPAPTPIQKGADKSYDDVESVRSRRSAETQADRQRAATPDLLQRDPSVPTPPKTGSPAPVSDKQKGVPTQATAAPSTAGKQAADNTPDWIKNISKPFTLPSDFVGDRSGSKQPSYDFNKNSSDLMSKAAQLLGKFKIDPITGNGSSTGMGSGAINRSPSENSARVAADAEARATRGMNTGGADNEISADQQAAYRENQRAVNARKVERDSEERATRGMRAPSGMEGGVDQAAQQRSLQAEREANAARVRADAAARSGRGMGSSSSSTRGMPSGDDEISPEQAAQYRSSQRAANARRVQSDSEERATRGMGSGIDQAALQRSLQAEREANAARVRADSRDRSRRGM